MQFLRIYSRMKIRGDVLDIIMLKDFLNTADDVADNAEDGIMTFYR